MALNDPYELDAVNATSNSNFGGANFAEGMAPSLVNNGVRYLGLMLARATGYKSASISASLSTNIAATGSGIYQSIIGVGPINSYGLVPGAHPEAAVIRLLHFASSCSVSHGASIILLGAASRRTQPGDISGVIHDDATADVWREWLFSRADGTPVAASISATTITAGSISASAISTVTLSAASASVTSIVFTTLTAGSISASVGNFLNLRVGGHGTVAQFVSDTNATYTTLGTILPVDDTIPQNTQGDEVLSVAITPINASSTLLIRADLIIGGAAGTEYAAALFASTSANAIAAKSNTPVSITAVGLTLEKLVSAGSTAARTYSVRVGSNSATDVFLNGSSTTRLFGGIAASTLTVMEILPQ